jgi:glutaminyl-tRNA synthetase
MEKSSNFIHDIIDKELAEGKVKEVYTRFPPEPNGYLHIGHAKSLVLNFGTAKKYGGKCNLRFDDTNPCKEDVEYVESIKEDIKWLGFEWDGLYYASDYFDQIYDLAVKLIKEGKAYVCDLSAEEIKEYRGTLTEPGKNSPYRERSIEENLRLFEEMRAGKYKEGEKVLRAKIDMASPNLNMRDPVLYRILYQSHHRTGKKWCIYPMYDFTHPISDAIEGITHSLCTLEFEDHRPLYDWTVENCGFTKKPRQIEFARLNITNTIMSKRFLKKLVDEKKVEGWDDPRMPTLCGIRKRGYPPEAIKDFCEKIGMSKANSEVDSGLLEHCVRENLNLNAERAMVVLNPLKVVITNYPENGEEVDFEINPNLKGQTRKIQFSKEIYIDNDDFSLNPPPKYFRLVKGGMVRLKSAYIIKCDDVVFDAEGNIDYLKCSYVPSSRSGSDSSGLKVKGVIHWVNAKTCKKINVIKYKPLLNPEITEGDFMDRLNKDSKTVYNSLSEPYICSCPDNSRFQFMRMGYYIKYGNDFIEIVDLKDSYGK